MDSSKKQKKEDAGNASPDDGPKDTLEGKNPAMIKCKEKRKDLYKKFKKLKKADRKKRRETNKREAEAMAGEEGPVRKQPKTIDNQRLPEETFVEADDEEVVNDEATDELANYFSGQRPKILVTTSQKAVSQLTYKFCEELINMMPDADFYDRKKYTVKEITEYAKKLNFTDMIIINEDRKIPNAMLLSHLPDGPTAHFKLTSIKMGKQIKNHARQTNHRPELILNNFNTRLGHRVGRMFAVLFPQNPEFLGRQVVTFHNQRDFIFFRQHRYIFKDGKKVGLQEIGPRFTLKLRSLQAGTFDSKFGEFEFVHNRKQLETHRRRFLL
eukprot:comp23351_c1_seq1/m.38563 comp23351_c1_seq1/g.38563  ORF comp23351_c1_seq1/g.38563 comp23351_c1_seq1/m.38563 type:complete len:326 (-) comp23351_c1_seq1:78-1055(-)